MTVVIKTLKRQGPLLIGVAALVLSTAAIAVVRPELPPGTVAAAVNASEVSHATEQEPARPMDQQPALARAEAGTTADSNACDRQHWPYYSRECLKGQGSPGIRIVSMSPASEPASSPVPVESAAGQATGRNVERKVASDGGHGSKTAVRRQHRSPKRYVAERMRIQPQAPVYQAAMDGEW